MERTLLDSGSLVTQDIATVSEMLRCLGRPQDPLPEVIDLGSVKLVRNNKRDAFYCTTEKSCSCPGFTYRGGPCKHQRKHFEESKWRGQTLAETLEEHDRNLHRMPKSYQRMVKVAREDAEAEPLEAINRSGFKPVLE
jgi:hypothetical protein